MGLQFQKMGQTHGLVVFYVLTSGFLFCRERFGTGHWSSYNILLVESSSWWSSGVGVGHSCSLMDFHLA